MLHVLILRLTVSPEEAEPHLSGHVDYLERYRSRGVFLFSVPPVPADLGGLILARGERAEVEAVMAEDPLVRNKVVSYELVPIDVGDTALNLGASPDSPAILPERWTFREYRALHPDTAGLSEALSGRTVGTVAHRAGSTVLAVLDTDMSGTADAARRCASELRDRGWQGDVLLADELERALTGRDGDDVLASVPVDLEELANVLDSDPAEGEGAFDPLTGDAMPGPVFEFELENDPSGKDDWIAVIPGSQDAYQDMVDFAEEAADGRLRERLLLALEGRGAFRRFKDVVHDADGGWLDAWTIFREERSLGRARQWLADHGYRPDERTALG